MAIGFPAGMLKFSTPTGGSLMFFPEGGRCFFAVGGFTSVPDGGTIMTPTGGFVHSGSDLGAKMLIRFAGVSLSGLLVVVSGCSVVDMLGLLVVSGVPVSGLLFVDSGFGIRISHSSLNVAGFEVKALKQYSFPCSSSLT